eukprot:1149506-Pelagomonas_calceolata.AAC.2
MVCISHLLQSLLPVHEYLLPQACAASSMPKERVWIIVACPLVGMLRLQGIASREKAGVIAARFGNPLNIAALSTRNEMKFLVCHLFCKRMLSIAECLEGEARLGSGFTRMCWFRSGIGSSGPMLLLLEDLVRDSPTPMYFYEVKYHAGIASNKCADDIAKNQARQDVDTPADTSFLCVNLTGNPFHDTTWLAFKETARTHANTLERPNSPAPKFKHSSNLHDALRTHMHSKHGLGKPTPRQDTTLIVIVYFPQHIRGQQCLLDHANASF